MAWKRSQVQILYSPLENNVMLVLVVIFITGFFDSLSLTGYFFYGTGIMAATSVAILAEYSLLTIFLCICAGAFAGDAINYFTGRHLGHHQKVRNIVTKAKGSKILTKFMYHENDALLRKIFLASVFRLFAVARPVNAVILGTISHSTIRDLAALATAVLLWTALWLSVFDLILQAVV